MGEDEILMQLKFDDPFMELTLFHRIIHYPRRWNENCFQRLGMTAKPHSSIYGCPNFTFPYYLQEYHYHEY